MHLNLNDPDDKRRLHELLRDDPAFAPMRKAIFDIARQKAEREASDAAAS